VRSGALNDRRNRGRPFLIMRFQTSGQHDR